MAGLCPFPSTVTCLQQQHLSFTEAQRGKVGHLAHKHRPCLAAHKFPACPLDQATLAGFSKHFLIPKMGLERSPPWNILLLSHFSRVCALCDPIPGIL